MPKLRMIAPLALGLLTTVPALAQGYAPPPWQPGRATGDAVSPSVQSQRPWYIPQALPPSAPQFRIWQPGMEPPPPPLPSAVRWGP